MIQLRKIYFVILFILFFPSVGFSHFDISPNDAKNMIDSNLDLIIIDVREEDEFCDTNGHISGALNYPWNSEILSQRLNELKFDDTILVICHGGSRSNLAATFLDNNGFLYVYDINGGMMGWLWDTETCSESKSEENCTININRISVTGTREVGALMTFAINANNSCPSTIYYRFSIHPGYGSDGYDGTQWESMTSSEWVSTDTISYTFDEAGKYIIVVWVTDDVTNASPSGIPIIGWSVDISDESQTFCIDPRPEVCTQQYDPVCGELSNATRKTYGNACTACSETNVVKYSNGVCP